MPPFKFEKLDWKNAGKYYLLSKFLVETNLENTQEIETFNLNNFSIHNCADLLISDLGTSVAEHRFGQQICFFFETFGVWNVNPYKNLDGQKCKKQDKVLEIQKIKVTQGKPKFIIYLEFQKNLVQRLHPNRLFAFIRNFQMDRFMKLHYLFFMILHIVDFYHLQEQLVDILTNEIDLKSRLANNRDEWNVRCRFYLNMAQFLNGNDCLKLYEFLGLAELPGEFI